MISRTSRLALIALFPAVLHARVGWGVHPYAEISQALAGIPNAKQSRMFTQEKASSREIVFDPAIQRRPESATWAPTDQIRPEVSMALKGLPMQRDTILLQVKPGANVDAVRELLDKHRLEVKGGVPDIGLLYVEREGAAQGDSDESSSAAVIALREEIDRLREEPIVSTAAPNTPIGPTLLPPAPQVKASGMDVFGNLHHWDWDQGPGSFTAQQRDGNYGQKMIRLPQAWNFCDAIEKRGNTSVKIGIVDVGFATHRDLSFAVSNITPLVADSHGNHVTGIVAATFKNKDGINGACPFATVTVCKAADTSTVTVIPEMYPILSEVIATLVELIRESDNVKAINLSLGYNWVPNYARNPNTDAEIQDLVMSHGIIMRAIADMAADKGIILVSAAGNDSRAPAFNGIEAQWASPLNWAAMNPGISSAPAINVIVVESTNRSGQLSPFSNVKGCVSAPGQNVLSAHEEDGQYYVTSGTSMAAPQVTGVIGLMYAYNPNLSIDQVVRILRADRRPAESSPASRLDAFAALLAARNESLTDLADLNVDGKVDLADFDLFKAAAADIQAAMPAQDHNGDGKILQNENIYPRIDLNGSGRFSLNETDRSQVKGKNLSDLEVMMEVWEDPQVAASDLPSRISQ